MSSRLLSDPSGSSDSLHSGSPSDRPRLLPLSLPLVCQCLSPSSLARYTPYSLSSLSGFFSQQPARGPAGSKVLPQPAQTAANTRTLLLLLLLPRPPHGPLVLLLHLARCRCRCCLRVEGDPDPTLSSSSGQDKNTQWGQEGKTHTLRYEGRATFQLCFESRNRR